MPTRCNRWLLIENLLFAQHVLGHHYAHHQELKSIIEVAAACGTWCFGFQVVGLAWSCGLCVRFADAALASLIMPIIRSSRVLYRWLLLVVLGALLLKLSVWL